MGKGASEAVKLTSRTIDALHPSESRKFLWDSEIKGFGVVVMPSGVKTFIYQYRMGGRGSKTQRMKLGRYGELTPDAARRMAWEIAGKRHAGTDPIAQRKAAEAEQEKTERASVELAFENVLERFLEYYRSPQADVRPSTYAFAENVLRVHALPQLRTIPIDRVTKRDIIAAIDTIPAERIAVRRNSFAMLRRLFNWAVAHELIADNPCKRFSKDDTPRKAESRDRVLSDHELALVMTAVRSMPYPWGPMFELLFATAQRREEAAGLRWEELNRAAALWTLPAERAKNGVSNIIPLNAFAIATLDRAAGMGVEDSSAWPSAGWVFTTRMDRPVSGHSKAKRLLDTAVAKIAENDGILLPPAWRLHDARRTVATGLQRLGVRFEVTEAVLNHVSGSKSGIAGVYQLHGWGLEKRAALEAWGAHIENLLNPANQGSNNVVALPQRNLP